MDTKKFYEIREFFIYREEEQRAVVELYLQWLATTGQESCDEEEVAYVSAEKDFQVELLAKRVGERLRWEARHRYALGKHGEFKS